MKVLAWVLTICQLHVHVLLCPFLNPSLHSCAVMLLVLYHGWGDRDQNRPDSWPSPSLTHRGQTLWSDPCLPLQPHSPSIPLLLSSFQPFGTAFISSCCQAPSLTPGPAFLEALLPLPASSSPPSRPTQPSTDWWMLQKQLIRHPHGAVLGPQVWGSQGKVQIWESSHLQSAVYLSFL